MKNTLRSLDTRFLDANGAMTTLQFRQRGSWPEDNKLFGQVVHISRSADKTTYVLQMSSMMSVRFKCRSSVCPRIGELLRRLNREGLRTGCGRLLHLEGEQRAVPVADRWLRIRRFSQERGNA